MTAAVARAARVAVAAGILAGASVEESAVAAIACPARSAVGPAAVAAVAVSAAREAEPVAAEVVEAAAAVVEASAGRPAARPYAGHR